jgi:hypothetical protein
LNGGVGRRGIKEKSEKGERGSGRKIDVPCIHNESGMGSLLSLSCFEKRSPQLLSIILWRRRQKAEEEEGRGRRRKALKQP